LRFEDVSFKVRDEQTGESLRLAAWWVPHPDVDGRCAVLIHGYADAKVGAVAWAPTWHALGYHLLILDLRAHGESGGKFCTGGYFERHDVNAVLNLLRAERPAETRQLVLFGVSMGAAVAVAAAAERARSGLDDLDALVLESPFADFAGAALAHMDRLGLPGSPFAPAAVALAQRLGGADCSAVRPAKLLAEVTCPVLIIRAEDDAYLPPADVQTLDAAIHSRPAGSGPAEWWHVEGTEHLMALAADPEKYRRRLGEFLARTEASRELAPPRV
jgi:alpha-beta hydrolase superfamily lysophospholipase